MLQAPRARDHNLMRTNMFTDGEPDRNRNHHQSRTVVRLEYAGGGVFL